MSYRFFGYLENGEVTLTSEDAFHLTKVLRIRKNEEFEIVVEDKLFISQISTFDPLKISVIEMKLIDSKMRSEVTLFYALPKGDKLEFVLQKATELGVNHIVLVESENSVVKFSDNKKKDKLTRFEKIIRSAAMQSKQDKIPTVSGPYSFKKCLEMPFDLRLFAHEKASLPFSEILNKELENSHSIALFVGPEGGFSPAEVKSATEANYNIISFGKSVLRSETAVIYGLSVLHHYLEEINL